MKLREGDPWMPASDYGRSLAGLTLNLLVSDIERALEFQREVLDASVVYSDPDFAVVSAQGVEWMLHADHTYDRHPMGETVKKGQQRGAGMEIRLHGRDPDQAVSAAESLGCSVLAPATDKGHGVREAFIQDAEGYIWVPDVPLQKTVSAD